MADPILYGPAYSTYVRTARLALEEKGVSHQLVEVDFLQGEMPAEQVARHPFGKVPAFEHDGFALYEACAISRYIDMAFAGPALQPTDAKGAARMTQIVSVLDSYAYGPTISQLVIQRMVQPMLGGQSDEAAISAALPAVDKAMAALDALIGDNAWLAGDALSLADLHAAPIFAYFTATPEAASILADKPGLHRWWEASTRQHGQDPATARLGRISRPVDLGTRGAFGRVREPAFVHPVHSRNTDAAAGKVGLRRRLNGIETADARKPNTRARRKTFYLF